MIPQGVRMRVILFTSLCALPLASLPTLIRSRSEPRGGGGVTDSTYELLLMLALNFEYRGIFSFEENELR